MPLELPDGGEIYVQCESCWCGEDVFFFIFVACDQENMNKMTQSVQSLVGSASH